MGKQVHQLNLTFFHERMKEHTAVSRHFVMPSDEHYLFRVSRKKYGPLTVLYTDAYEFSEADALLMPPETDYIVIVPHASYDTEIRRHLSREQVGIGDIRKFMGAINYSHAWEYRTQEERKQDEEDGWFCPQGEVLIRCVYRQHS